MPDPFDLLAIPPAFNIDDAALHRAWLSGSARLHPDRAEADADEAQRLALLAALNQSKAILSDPIRRAEALLERLGGPAKESDKTLPEGFLVEMLEVREQLEEAGADPAEVAKWEAWAGRRRGEAIATVAGLFDTHASTPSPRTLADIRRELNAWRYIERMIEQLPRD